MGSWQWIKPKTRFHRLPSCCEPWCPQYRDPRADQSSLDLSLRPYTLSVTSFTLLNTQPFLILVLSLWLQLPYIWLSPYLTGKGIPNIPAAFTLALIMPCFHLLFGFWLYICKDDLLGMHAASFVSSFSPELPPEEAPVPDKKSAKFKVAQNLQHFLLIKSLIFVLSIWNRRWISSASILYFCTFCWSAKVFLCCFLVFLLYSYKSVDHSCKIQISSQFSWRPW